jgi:hypothetical protein
MSVVSGDAVALTAVRPSRPEAACAVLIDQVVSPDDRAPADDRGFPGSSRLSGATAEWISRQYHRC